MPQIRHSIRLGRSHLTDSRLAQIELREISESGNR